MKAVFTSAGDFFPRLIHLLERDEESVVLPTLVVISFVVPDNRERTNMMLIPALAKLLNHSVATIVESTVNTLNCITTSTAAQIQCLFTHKVVEPLLNVLANGSFSCKKQVILTIGLIVQGTFSF